MAGDCPVEAAVRERVAVVETLLLTVAGRSKMQPRLKRCPSG